MEETKKSNFSGYFIKIMTVQTVCVALILVLVLTAKYFLPKTFLQIRKWYDREMCDDTDINEVVSAVHSTEYEI